MQTIEAKRVLWFRKCLKSTPSISPVLCLKSVAQQIMQSLVSQCISLLYYYKILHYFTNHHITTSTQCTLTTDLEAQQMLFNRTLHYTEPTKTLFNTFRLNFRHASVHKHRLYGTFLEFSSVVLHPQAEISQISSEEGEIHSETRLWVSGKKTQVSSCLSIAVGFPMYHAWEVFGFKRCHLSLRCTVQDNTIKFSCNTACKCRGETSLAWPDSKVDKPKTQFSQTNCSSVSVNSFTNTSKTETSLQHCQWSSWALAVTWALAIRQ